jgi:hypothetical protein
MHILGLIFLVILALVVLFIVGLLLASASSISRYTRIRKM